MIRCYILSEPGIAQALVRYIGECPFTTCCGQSTSHNENNVYITADLVFIEISQITENPNILSTLYANCNIVLLSRDPHRAGDAFELMAFDFISLPLGQHRFNACIDKFINLSRHYSRRAERKNVQPKDAFFIKAGIKGQRELFVKCKDLSHIEALDEQIILHLCGGEKIHSHLTLKEMLDYLPKTCFLRIHKSYIINADRIHAIEGNLMFLQGQSRALQIGNSYRKLIMDFKLKNMIRKQKQLIGP